MLLLPPASLNAYAHLKFSILNMYVYWVIHSPAMKMKIFPYNSTIIAIIMAVLFLKFKLI